MDISYIITEKQMEEWGIDITGELDSNIICEQGENIVFLAKDLGNGNYKLNSFFKY